MIQYHHKCSRSLSHTHIYVINLYYAHKHIRFWSFCGNYNRKFAQSKRKNVTWRNECTFFWGFSMKVIKYFCVLKAKSFVERQSEKWFPFNCFTCSVRINHMPLRVSFECKSITEKRKKKNWLTLIVRSEERKVKKEAKVPYNEKNVHDSSFGNVTQSISMYKNWKRHGEKLQFVVIHLDQIGPKFCWPTKQQFTQQQHYNRTEMFILMEGKNVLLKFWKWKCCALCLV